MRRYIILAAALLAGAAATAQNLNPTVQVTNDYESKPMEVEKQSVQMAVPDSLLKFDWNFNYSVFDNPYRGAYEFSPYRIEMKPGAAVRDNRRFYLRAGAGYTLHPEAQLVFTPDVKGRFGVSVYDDFKGSFGPYHKIDVIRGGKDALIGKVDDKYTGSDLSNRLGTTLRYDAPKAVLTFDAGMDLIKTKECFFGGNKMLGGSAAFRARSLGESDFLYDVKVGWTGLGNTVLVSDSNSYKYTEHDAGFDAKFLYRLASAHSLRFEPSFHHVAFKDDVFSLATADVVDIIPSYTFSDEGFTVKVGIHYSDVWRDCNLGDKTYLIDPLVNGNTYVADYKGRKLYPEFRLYYEAIPDMLVLSAKVVGGQKFNTYGSYLKDNHHLSQYASWLYSVSSGDATANTFDAGIGVSGRVRSIFQYGAEAGFARYYNAPLDGLVTTVYADVPSVASSTYEYHYVFQPVITMMNYDLLYADATGAVTADRIDASAHLRVQKSNLKPEMERGYFAMTLPVFVGSADFVYNWNRRIFAGLSAEWATGRTGEDLYIPTATYTHGTDGSTGVQSYDTFDCHVPGWLDLGVNLELKVSNRFSLWAEGRNLLNKTVMRNFMIAEKGPWITAGICLNL